MKKSDFSVIRLGMFESEKLVGICQIFEINAKRGHFFHLRHGPIFTDYESYFDYFFSYIKQLAKEKQVSFIRISPLIDKNHKAFFTKRGFRESLMHAMDAEVCWVLDITQSEEQLLMH